MKRFEAIIQSETEPTTDCLWLKHGRIYWWTSQGWKPLADSDTRYKNEFVLNPDVAEEPITSTSTMNIKNGISTNTYSIGVYNGQRAPIANSDNFATENAIHGLLHIITELSIEVNNLRETVDDLHEHVSDLMGPR